MLLAAVVAFVAAAIQGTLGFGFGMVSMSLLSLAWSVREAAPVVALAGLALNLGLVWRYRKVPSLAEARPLLGGSLIGVPLGLAFLVGAPARALQAVLGSVLVGYVLLRLSRWAPAAAPPRWVAVIAGLCGGVLGAAFNSGGPPVVLYASARTDWPPVVFRAVLSAYFVLQGGLVVVLMAAGGILGTEQVIQASLAVPAAVFGGWLGTAIAERVAPERFRRMIVAGLAILGAAFLLRAVRG